MEGARLLEGNAVVAPDIPAVPFTMGGEMPDYHPPVMTAVFALMPAARAGTTSRTAR
jgi:hypothetical protein